MSYQTDERLKGFLDTNQLSRERMCLAILSLDKRFSNVRPRHPRGGPDGGRDIEATYRGSHLAYGAVGFVNQAADTDDKKRDVRAKFRDDLANAREAEPRPDVFVFMTNINFTVGEKDGLKSEATAAGFIDVDIFDRERLRIALDSPDGLAARFQFLDIPLSDAEQRSFFAKWGDDINSVIATGFQEVRRTLDHLLFLQEAHDPITGLHLVLDLDRSHTGKELGHFRAFCMLTLKEPKLRTLSLLFGCADVASRFAKPQVPTRAPERAGVEHSVGAGQWVQHFPSEDEQPSQDEERYTQVGSSSAIGIDQTSAVRVSYECDSFIRFKPQHSLRDFDDCIFLPIVSAKLAQHIKRLRVFANGYLLLEVGSDQFHVDDTTFDPEVPVSFSQAELADPWVRIRPTIASAFRISFSEHVPVRLFAAKRAGDPT